MYDNAHIYLKRKYDKWLAFYESKKEKGSKFRERDCNPTLSEAL